MNKIILIGGELATGKTTLAKSLSESLNIPYFYKDILKEKLADSIGFKNREENKKLSVMVFDIFLHICEQFIASKKDLILESNFKQNEIDKLSKLFMNTNYEIVSIVLTGDDDILYERYLNRFKFENRHKAHANFENKKEFTEYNNELKKVQYIGKILNINANKFIDPKSLIDKI